MRFSKKKFLSLPKTRQHKKCAEILKNLITSFDPELFSHLLELEGYIGIHLTLSNSLETLSNAYHQHLQAAHWNIKEYQLLFGVKTQDRETPLREPYPIDIYLDQLRSAHNVGSIIRTCEAFQLGSLYFSKDTPFIDNPKVIKTAMGTVQGVKSQVLGHFNELKRPIIALETSTKATSLFEFEFPPSFTLILGNEELGLSSQSLSEADHFLEIPLAGMKNSLNVASAFSITAAFIENQFRAKLCPI